MSAFSRPWLYHFCCEHSRRDIGEIGSLRPNFHPKLGYKLVWLTTDPRPERIAVGLTMFTISCDRMAHRYVVTDARDCERFYDWCERREIDGNVVSGFVVLDGVRPETWWVSEKEVPVRVSRIEVPS